MQQGCSEIIAWMQNVWGIHFCLFLERVSWLCYDTFDCVFVHNDDEKGK